MHGYELFYSGGGHVGPFYRLADAVQAARSRLRGCPSLDWIDVVALDAKAVGGYGDRIQRLRQTDDDPQPNQMAY